MDGAFAVTSQLQRVGHQTSTVLADIKGVFLVVRLLGTAVGNNHLDDTDAVEESSLAVFIHVVGTYVGNDNTLAVVEADVHLVVGPGQLVATNLEGDALRLSDIDGLESLMVVLVADELGQVVVFLERDRSALAVDVANIDAEHLLGFGVGHDGEVERVGVLVVEIGVSVVGQALLQTALKAPALVNADGPGIQEDLGHVVDANFLAGADNTGVIASNALHDIEIFESESGHHILHFFPLLDLGLGQVHHDLGDLGGLALDDDGKCPTVWRRDSTLAECSILGLARFSQSEAVELDRPRAGIFPDELGRLRDFLDGQLICTR